LIDSTLEELITLLQAAAELPHRRRGRKTHVSTVYRWGTDGCRGVILETLQCGATRCTSREALQRFFERLSSGGGNPPAPVKAPRSSARRARESAAAGDKLEKQGA
jgi:hypothetical protein